MSVKIPSPPQWEITTQSIFVEGLHEKRFLCNFGRVNAGFLADCSRENAQSAPVRKSSRCRMVLSIAFSLGAPGPLITRLSGLR